MNVKDAVGIYSPKVKAVLESFLNEKTKLYDDQSFGITIEIIEFIKTYILAEVRQSRPTLFLIGYIASNNDVTENTIATSIFTTFFTKYLAIHDDIIDKDTIKNGVPTIHIQGKKFNGSEKMGNDLAILAGDFLWSWAIDSVLNSDVPLERRWNALEAINKTNELTNVGQIMDLDFVMKKFEDINDKDVWLMYTNKAAIYCYVMPLTVGAILGGLPTKIVVKLEEYAKLVGAASQLRDDVEGVFSEEKITGKSNIVDLQMGVKSLLIVKSFELATNDQKDLLRKYVGKDDLTQEEADKVRQIIVSVGAKDYCEKVIIQKGDESLTILREIKDNINSESYEYLEDLVKFRLRLN